jgi:hypothetical protein
VFRETNPLTVLLVVAILGGLFYGFHVGPLYLDNLEVKEACSQAINVWTSEGNLENGLGAIRKRLNLAGVGWHFDVDDEGLEVIKPGLGIPDENFELEEDDTGTVRTCRVTYTRTVQFSPLKKRKTYPFVVQVKQVMKK